MIPSTSAAHAKAYFSDALSKADYYLNDQELQGQMRGKLAERLGLVGPVTKDVFFALCENINPTTGENLTPRTKDNRVTGWDCNFHVPKSVSILHSLSNDDHILDAFRESVRLTMLDMEQDVKTRVRKDGLQDERQTGELLYSEFIHQTARPVDGHLPDPHLHAHCFIFNATWDEKEQEIKSARVRDVFSDIPYYHARFHKRLSDKLIELGYQIRRTDKSFEVEGVPQAVIDLFSKRTDEIGRIAKDKGITDAKELDALGARTRSRKQKGHTMAELQAEWRKQILDLDTGDKDDGKQIIRFAPAKEKTTLTSERCVEHALEHGFERASVLQDRRLLASAYRHSIGDASVKLDSITDRFKSDERLIHVEEKGRILCTTRQVLQEEQRMVKLAQAGQGKLKPLYTKAPEVKLDGQQADAIRHVLTTTHRVSIIRGAAGSGKTTLMSEATAWMKKAGKTVTVVAPTSQASRGVLREEGFEHAETVARLLSDEKMQQALIGQVIWVDEAGLLSNQDMTALLGLAQEKNARLILGGDTRQHASVVRGDALRILNTVGGIQTAEVSKIYRQRDAGYRTAVEDLSRGDVRQAFARLDSMGSIQSVDPLKPNEALVKDYVATLRKGKSALIVSPTHQQAEAVTEAIRDKMKASGLLGKKEISATRLTNLNMTEAQKSDWRNFRPGQIIQFNQNRPGIKRGSVWTVDTSTDKGVIIKNEEGHSLPLPTGKSGDYDLYRKDDLALAKGDSIRITRNGFDAEKNRLNNGQILEVISVNKAGELHLRNSVSKADYKLSKEYGHLAHAYCVTSHASQGKTVDEVFISQPAATFPATDAKQFYVSVSRGRDRARIYTDDKEQLLDHASRLGDRQSASELVKRKNQTLDMVQQRIRADLNRTPVNKGKPKEVVKPARSRDRDYEPGL
ncbi:MobF family relaxase [Spirosoma foliorum]|uniref:Relaxase domain-containing protein n=1 Tax=Spirosoma foliorum TaxID=2710596 RepID=A0A7G5H7L4_9BACT|nr:MobF family relaxase [Spirosoma foliorum]QMW07106.1 relaxase domain-containing protein [Spirosoma foliorum]